MTSELIYLRRYRLRLGRGTGSLTYEMTPDSDGLRITFQITHFAGGAFSVAEITVYNVLPYSAKNMLDGSGTDREGQPIPKYKYISFEAGYEELFGTIFVGQIINSQVVLEDAGATRGIRFYCNSLAQERRQNLVNLSLAPSTPPIDVIRSCAETFGTEIQFYGDFSALTPRAGGSALQGDPVACMNELGEAYAFDWMAENNVLKIIKRGFAMENVVYIINSETGMKGSPIVTDTEVGIRYILNPKLKLGDTIKLESIAPQYEFSGVYVFNVPRNIGDGFYKIFSLVFVGDSHGDYWDTQISCLRLGAMAQSNISERATR